MNGKPPLVFGQAQLSGISPQMTKSQYTKPSLMPVGQGNSFASIFSSTVDKADGSVNIGGSNGMGNGVKGAMKGMMPGGQSTFLGSGSSPLFNGGNLPSPQGKSVTKIGASPAQVSSQALGQGPLQASGQASGQANTTQASTVSQRMSTIPKNYSFGMEDTRGQSVKKMPAVATAPTSARAINVAARNVATRNVDQSHSKNAAPALMAQLAAKNGSIRETPYRGLALSQEGMDKNVLASLNSGNGGKNSFVSPLLAGGSNQLIMQLFKEIGHVVGTVSDRLQLKEPAALAQSTTIAKKDTATRRARQSVAAQNVHANPSANLSLRPDSKATGRSLASSGVSSGATPAEPAKMGASPASASPLGPRLTPMDINSLGALSAKFESGESGIAAIGYDRHGGTSYGKYQISSRAGTFSKFMEYLEINGPDLAAKLREGGPANTGGRNGRMPNVWRSIAESEPERFEQLQTDFIMSSHFQPAMSAIAEATGVAFNGMPEALREVVFSTAVQHGVSGAARIISRAVASVGADKLTASEEAFVDRTGQDLIRQIYAIRARQFSSSTNSVRSAVQNRLQHEMRDALTLLRTTDVQQTPNIRHMGTARV